MPDQNAPPATPAKNALVTGASRRIGAAIACHLARAGTNIALHHHGSPEEAEALCEQLRRFGVRAIPLQADLEFSTEVTSLFTAASDQLGTIDLLINNASAFVADEPPEFDDEIWNLHFNLHVKAPSLLAFEMAKQNNLLDGMIINLIDQRVWRLTPKFYSYTLSKSALWTATQTLAQALAPNIRVNAIGPGPTLPNERQSEADFAKQVKGLILDDGPKLEEFGDTISYLWQSKSVTGQMIALDGGQHLAWETPDIVSIRE